MRRTPARLLALGLAVVWAVVPILSGLHGTEGHRYCAEHQALEELPASAPGRADSPTTGIAGAPADVATEHRACPFAVAAAGSLAPETPATAAVAPPRHRPPPLPFAPPPPAAAILDLAPKTSPPLLAV